HRSAGRHQPGDRRAEHGGGDPHADRRQLERLPAVGAAVHGHDRVRAVGSGTGTLGGMMGRGMWAVLAAVVAVAPRPASAMLSTPGFRAVGVAHSAYPISSLALAPDGRL